VIKGEAFVKASQSNRFSDRAYTMETRRGRFVPQPTLGFYLTWPEFIHDNTYVLLELRFDSVSVARKRGMAILQ
jgi:hypothetical protein